MGFVVFLIFFSLFIFIIVRAAKSGSAAMQGVNALNTLGASGIPARGLVLASSQIAVASMVNGRVFESRSMTLDVEIPGRPPYICNGTFLVPRGLVEPIPGASLELAVNASNPNQIAVLGPGGFTGPWIRLGPPGPY